MQSYQIPWVRWSRTWVVITLFVGLVPILIAAGYYTIKSPNNFDPALRPLRADTSLWAVRIGSTSCSRRTNGVGSLTFGANAYNADFDAAQGQVWNGALQATYQATYLAWSRGTLSPTVFTVFRALSENLEKRAFYAAFSKAAISAPPDRPNNRFSPEWPINRGLAVEMALRGRNDGTSATTVLPALGAWKPAKDAGFHIPTATATAAVNLPSRRQRFCPALSAVTGYTRCGTHPSVSASFVSQEVVPIHDPAAHSRATFFLFQDSPPELSCQLHPFPQVPQKTTYHTQPRGGRSIDRLSSQPFSSHLDHDS